MNLKYKNKKKGKILFNKFDNSSVDINKLSSNDIKYTNKAVAEPHTEYYKISFSILEAIIKNDFKIFNIIQNYVHNQRNIISKADMKYTESELENFTKNEHPGFICLPDGKIYKINDEFCKTLNVSEVEFKKQKQSIYNIIETYSHDKIESVSKMTNGKY